MKKTLFILFSFVIATGITLAQDYQVGFKQNGKASYYADKYHGKKTASEEPYNMFGMTCAHRKLPFNSIVKVTNTANGKWVTLRVNDRGPFTPKRVLDVSKKAALKLDMVKNGIIDIEIEVLRVGGDGPAVVANTKANKPVIKEVKPANQVAAQNQTQTQVQQQVQPQNVVANQKTTGVANRGGAHSDQPEIVTVNKKKPNKLQKAQPVIRPTKKAPTSSLRRRFNKVGTYNIWGTASKPSGFAIQIGAFNDINKAIIVGREAIDLGLNEIYIQTGWVEKKKTYRLLYGSEADADIMRDQIRRVKRKGFYKAFVKEHYK